MLKTFIRFPFAFIKQRGKIKKKQIVSKEKTFYSRTSCSKKMKKWKNNNFQQFFKLCNNAKSFLFFFVQRNNRRLRSLLRVSRNIFLKSPCSEHYPENRKKLRIRDDVNRVLHINCKLQRSDNKIIKLFYNTST